jgi:hypothetical protein
VKTAAPGWLIALVAVSVAACGRPATVGSPATPPQQPPSAVLVVYATQRIALTPTSIARADSLGWLQRLGGPVAAGRMLDSAISTALYERAVSRQWFMPTDLMRSYERNRSYATNPYELTTTALRASAFQTASRYGEPLSSQLRTMIALHESVRMVLIPVELRFEKEGKAGRAILRAVLLDARAADARWVGEVRGDTSSVPRRALDNVASRFADLFVAQ